MSSSCWQIAGKLATLRTESLTATVEPLNPAGGLRIERLCGNAVAGAALFGVQIEPMLRPHDTSLAESASSEAMPVDCFARGNDFVATYAETADRPFRAQIYWRLVSEPAAGNDLRMRGEPRPAPIAALELIVSVQTSRLDSDTALAVCTRLGPIESWRLFDAADDAADYAAVPDNGPARSGNLGTDVRGDGLRGDGPQGGATVAPESHVSNSLGCCLLRPIGTGPSYIEMVHPADFRQTTFQWTTDSAPEVRLAHRLFVERLEKGVILRSRIRGLFVPRSHDAELARSEYRRFAASEPPLTT
jgi:hypothetical protein